MARECEKSGAFDSAVKSSPQGRLTVTTVDFVAELAKRNWHLSLRDANKWIENNICTFMDISTNEGEERTFVLFNLN
ncbi:DNA polymerase V [Rouxiella badensis]|uniref:DNA polymerase V n=1 Tax=Rouxiella badensis TaxID=1646377 RepID=UPI001B5FE3E0|nr:DNA polymerase V [Rouxiella badensis]MCC3747223.1 DNA polymerase V [Rouxiella badensis]